MLNKCFEDAKNDINAWNEFLKDLKKTLKRNIFLETCSVIIMSIALFKNLPNNYYILILMLLLVIIYVGYSRKRDGEFIILSKVMIERECNLSKKDEEIFDGKCFKLFNTLNMFNLKRMFIYILIVLGLFCRDFF